MDASPNVTEFELICAVVNDDIGSRVLRIAKNNGILGGTIFYGQGTVKNRLLELLDLCEVRREIVFMVSKTGIVRHVLGKLNKELNLKRPHHGIAFSMPVASFIGARNQYSQIEPEDLTGGQINMYQAIFTVVEKGLAENVVEAAVAAGSRGGTIINARGSGVHETSKLFSMDIEPEKEIVLILAQAETAETIVNAICDALKIEEPGNGVVFAQDVTCAYGLY